jgi:putative oxidoreductase
MFDSRTAAYGALLLRLTIGGLFVLHLYWKFAILGVSTWWGNLEQAGYPDWVIAYTISAEFVGAVLITLGIYARWAALYAFPMMVGATLFWVARKGFYFTAAGYELPLVWSILPSCRRFSVMRPLDCCRPLRGLGKRNGKRRSSAFFARG